MDPKLVEVTQLFARFKAAYARNDLDVCANLLSQLKVRPSIGPTDLAHLFFFRDLFDSRPKDSIFTRLESVAELASRGSPRGRWNSYMD
jgi:hypothetical protein